jgi:hypothetical protein
MIRTLVYSTKLLHPFFNEYTSLLYIATAVLRLPDSNWQRRVLQHFVFLLAAVLAQLLIHPSCLVISTRTS